MDDEQGGLHHYTSPPCSENIEGGGGGSRGQSGIVHPGAVDDRDGGGDIGVRIMNEREMAQGTKISKERKRLAELLDQLQRERGVNISEVDSSQWNDLVRDAQRLLEAEKRQI